MNVAHVLYVIVAVAVIAAVILNDHFLPDSAERELAKWYQGQKRRRARRGSTD
jgi:fatty acid desaturase